MTNRVVAEIDLGAIRNNVSEICGFVGPRVAVMPVVKADAYGHGALEVARVALESGADWLGVATVEEGVALRKVLPSVNIAVFAPINYDDAETVVLNRLTTFLSDMEGAQALSRAGQKLRGGARVHLEVDTGMGRSGALPDMAIRITKQVARMPSILICGLTTHFPSAEDGPDFTMMQLSQFLKTAEAVKETDTQLQHIHCANSAALLRYPGARMNMVRPGLLIYGIVPTVPESTLLPALRPALTLKTHVALVRALPEGHTISYGRTHILRRPSLVATLPVGYGDGYPRALGNFGEVLINGQRAPIIGRICMDVTMVDVTEIPNVEQGTEVVLIGAQGEDRITVEELARSIQTTEHDITTRLTARVPRIFKTSK
jgi:alanine racemase